MTKFQKIAVGLLGLTHPEMFILKFRPDSKSPPGTDLAAYSCYRDEVRLASSSKGLTC